MLMLTLLSLLVTDPKSASIEVFSDSVIGIVSPYLFSSGDEMNEDFSQPGLDTLVSFIGIPLLRMGGISAEYLDWEANNYNGIFYIDFTDTSIIPQYLTFGVDSILQFCERTGTEPILTVNFQINDPTKAARLVEYCNGDTTTLMGAIRANRGHPEPYNVAYWCIGNEPDISGGSMPFPPWGIFTFYRHFGIPFENWSWRDSSFVTPADFSALIDVYIDSMRAHSPIPLKIGGLSLAGTLSWIETVIGENNNKIDWMDIHYYPCWGDTADSNYYRAWLAAPDTGFFSLPVEDWYQQVCDSVEKYSGGYDIPVHIFEFNSGIINYYDPLWWNYLNGLFIADVLGHFMKAGVPMSAVYCIYDKDPPAEGWWAASIIRGDTLSMRSSAWVLKLYLDFFGDILIKTTSDVFGFNVYGSIKNSDTLALIVINKSLDSAYTSTINLHGFTSNDTMQVWDITNDSTLAAPWNGTKGIIYQSEYTGDSSSFTYTFPKASVSALWIAPKEEGIEENAKCNVQSAKLEIYPNPFREKTVISYTLFVNGKNTSRLTPYALRIFDVSGRLIRTLSLPSSPFSPRSSVVWDGRDNDNNVMPSGVYFVKLKLDDEFARAKKLLLLR
ncbi:T9SS type A sorting domain-containing protein [candidate division WOR-3 bacterium]|nr:T9SS type A sorting domain-containing protein [candidate division WOR-3 bacterium]